MTKTLWGWIMSVALTLHQGRSILGRAFQQYTRSLLSSITTTQHKEPKTVLIYGDSNAWGFDPHYCLHMNRTKKRFPYHRRYSTILQTLLGSDYLVLTEGLSSRTTVYDDLEGSLHSFSLISIKECCLMFHVAFVSLRRR